MADDATKTGYRLAEVLAFGDEMTSGQRLDTNSQWLSQELGRIGLRTMFHSMAGDDMDAMLSVLRTAIGRADVIITTGGLGPTQDDLTRDAMAMVAGVGLEERPDALAHIEKLFAKRKRPMPERNRLQAMFPVGSQIVPNPHGTAPGIDLHVPRGPDRPAARIVALPGVPAEMVTMWNDTVRPRLLRDGGLERRAMQSSVIKLYGVGESEAEKLLGDMIRRDHVPRVGITVSRATIALRIFAEADTQAACQAMIDVVRKRIDDAFGEMIFGEGDDYELTHAVCDLLGGRGESFCTIELGHAAILAQELSALERPTTYLGGLQLADDDRLARLAAAWQVTTDGVAERWRQSLGADYALVVGRYPVVSGHAAGQMPSADVQLTVLGDRFPKPMTTSVELLGHPDVLRHRIAKSGLSWMRKVVGSNH
jgi:nicotinamide-nucleotide amidase